MTKKEIVKSISDSMDLTQLKTKEIVQKTFDAIIETLVWDTEMKLREGEDGTLGRIELRNFGVFEVKKRAARKARNPKTGERVDVPEKLVVTFKPGKEMEEQVRKLEERLAEEQKGTAGRESSARRGSSIPLSAIAPQNTADDISSPSRMETNSDTTH